MSFWLSARGRNVVRVLAAVGVSGAFLRFYLPNTYYLPNIRNITQLYRYVYVYVCGNGVQMLQKDIEIVV